MQETQLTRKKTILNATPTITHHLPGMPGKFEVVTGPCSQMLQLHFLTHQKYSVQKTVLYADDQERIRHARGPLTSGMARTKAAAADRTGHQLA